MRSVLRLDGIVLSGRTYRCHPSVQVYVKDSYESTYAGKARSGSTEIISVYLYDKPEFKQHDLITYDDNKYIVSEIINKHDGNVVKLVRDYV